MSNPHNDWRPGCSVFCGILGLALTICGIGTFIQADEYGLEIGFVVLALGLLLLCVPIIFKIMRERKETKTWGRLEKEKLEAVPSLIKALSTKDRQVRGQAARDLSHTNDTRVLVPLIKAFRYMDSDVQDSVANAIEYFPEKGKMLNMEDLEPIINALESEQGRARLNAVKVLKGIEHKPVIESLVTTYNKLNNYFIHDDERMNIVRTIKEALRGYVAFALSKDDLQSLLRLMPNDSLIQSLQSDYPILQDDLPEGSDAWYITTRKEVYYELLNKVANDKTTLDLFFIKRQMKNSAIWY